uniref:Putative sulfotransferase domain contining protein n=1 Tax=viral metagenome TaxID=1070528 RepID=A0A6M3KE03_9ZZZZ
MVVVTGMPDSGTSFLSVLVNNLGLSLGDPDRIKGKSEYHPWGCGENLDMLFTTWRLLDKKNRGFPHVRYLAPDTLPEMPLGEEECRAAKEEMEGIIAEQGIELAKDASAPWTYKAFPDDAKYIVISRNWRMMHRDFLGFLGYTEGEIGSLQSAWVKWHRVCLGGIKSEREWLQLEYEEFQSAFSFQVVKICNFLRIGGPKSMDELYTLYCPREGRQA